MIEFNVYRAQIRSHAELQKFISAYWNAGNIKYRGSNGVISSNAESIVTGFEMTQRSFYKSIQILVHCISITFSKEELQECIINTINMLRNQLAKDYQFIDMIVEDAAGNIEVGFIINSVSYRTGQNFHDNNASLTALIKSVEQMAGKFCGVRFGGNVFFKSVGSNMGCYVK